MRDDRTFWTNCTKTDPAICRLHAHSYARFLSDLPDLTWYGSNERLAEQYYAHVRTDLRANLNRGVDTDGVERVSVYRAGELPGGPILDADGAAVIFDAARTDLRQGRMGAIFAAPTLGATDRWLENRRFGGTDTNPVLELRVDPTRVHIYPVEIWEEDSLRFKFFGHVLPERAALYWRYGMPLANWLRAVERGVRLDPTRWELLLDRQGIAGQPTSVSDQRQHDAVFFAS